MTKFYTGKGDKGQSFVGRRKISKAHPLVTILGELDELNSWVGYCRGQAQNVRGKAKKKKWEKELAKGLLNIQQILFILQAELAGIIFKQPSQIKITAAHTAVLERAIAVIDRQVPTITKFIIPGASELSARLDIARALARRAERALKTATKNVKITPEMLAFANRLSSYLFAAARLVNFKLKIKEENPSYK